MPFDVPADISGGIGIPSVGELIRTGIGLGASYLESRFSAPQGGFTTGGFMEGTQDDQESGGVPAIQTGITGYPAGDCGCNGRARLPDFLPYAAGPQCGYTRLSTMTKCGVTVQVWKPPRKKPRMNPYNMRAANRAARRLSSLGRGLKRQRKAVAKAARELK